MKIHFFVFKMDQMWCDDALTIAKHIPKMKIILYLHQKKEIDDAFAIAQHIPNTMKIFFWLIILKKLFLYTVVR